MKKVLRIILISLGAVAAIAGFASLSFGMTSLFSRYRDAKTQEVSEPEQSSKTSSSENSGSSSSSGGASSSSEAPISSSDPGSSSSDPGSSSSQEPEEPEEVGLVLSKSKIFLDDEEQGAASDTITATVTGCDSTVTWLVTSSNYVAVSSATTNSGEANTVSCDAIFENVENIRVSLTDDPSIYEDVKVYYLNIPNSLGLNTIGVEGGSESISTGYNNPVTYDQDGIYFESNSYMTNNRYGEFFDTPEEAMSAGKCLLVTASQGCTINVQFKLRPEYKQYMVQWPAPYEDFEFTDYWNWFDEDDSTMLYETLSCFAPSYNSLYWTYKISIELPSDFNGKTGDFVINFGGKYFDIHFNAYIPSAPGE